MKGEFYAAIAQIASERSLAKDVILESVEAALISAYKRMTGSDQSVTVHIDPATGQAHVFAQKTVVEQVEDPRAEISLARRARDRPGRAARRHRAGGDHPANFGRIAAQTAKQVVMQRIREAERDRFFSEYIDRVGDIVNVMVQRVDPRVGGPLAPRSAGRHYRRDRQGRSGAAAQRTGQDRALSRRPAHARAAAGCAAQPARPAADRLAGAQEYAAPVAGTGSAGDP